MLIYVLAMLALLVWCVGVFLLTGFSRASGGDLALLRAGLCLIGLVAAVAAVLFLKRRRLLAGPAGGGAMEEVAFLVRGANERLAASVKIRKGGARVPELPAVLLLGESGSTKTTVVVNSGLEPELLAGQDRTESGAAPATRSANLWLTNGTVLVEAAGGLLSDLASLRTLAAGVAPAAAGSLLGASQPPRAVIVCLDCEALLRPDAGPGMVAAGKKLNGLIGEIASSWGSRVPIYVLFTKLDRVTYFADYVRNLGMDEANQVFGRTLALQLDGSAGIYNQAQAGLLGTEFESLFAALANKRSDYMRRENDQAVMANSYEFPREFRKLRDNVVAFLLELGRPSQLHTSPFLRGFYFTGVRPVVVEDRTGGAARRRPQWVFAGQFFLRAVLDDKIAMAASGSNREASLTRRVLLSAAAAACLLLLGGTTASFLRNRGLMQDARDASAALGAMRFPPDQPAPKAALDKLEELRIPSQRASDFMTFSPPMSYRWGLFPGQPMHDAILNRYCEGIRPTLLRPVQAVLSRQLASVPPSPGPNDDYERPYNYLKAYLMTTRHPEKADAAFLERVLTEAWANGREVTPDQLRLARTQFAFYAQRRQSGFCPAPPDDGAIRRARAYLWQFRLEDRIYRNMLDEIARQGAPIRFLDPTGAVADPREVSFAFGKAGYASMQAAILKALDYVNREPWVLGEGQTQTAPGEILSQLRSRYQSDFIAQWTQFLDAGRVERYGSLRDASLKLNSTASARSPLLQLFCLISRNTEVDNQEVRKIFGPIQSLVNPASCGTALIGEGSEDYMRQLASLKVGVDRIVNAPNPDAERLSESDGAKTAAMTAAQRLNLPPKAGQLLQDPILFVEALMKGVPAAAINGKGVKFCQELAPLLTKYPFNPKAAAQARPDELAAVFQPGSGRLYSFYMEALQEYMTYSGGRYSAKADARVPVNAGFVAFYNRAAGIGAMLFPGGPTPKVSYALQVLPSSEIDEVNLTIDGRQLKAGKGGGRSEFTWPDGGGGVRLRGRAKDLSAELPVAGGPWAVVQFFGAADRVGANRLLEYDLRSSASIGRVATSQQVVPLKILLDMKGAQSSLLPRDLQLSCVPRIAQ